MSLVCYIFRKNKDSYIDIEKEKKSVPTACLEHQVEKPLTNETITEKQIDKQAVTGEGFEQ